MTPRFSVAAPRPAGRWGPATTPCSRGPAFGERDADATFRLVYAALVQRVMYGADFESDVPLSDRLLTRMLGDAAVRYLQLDQERP